MAPPWDGLDLVAECLVSTKRQEVTDAHATGAGAGPARGPPPPFGVEPALLDM